MDYLSDILSNFQLKTVHVDPDSSDAVERDNLAEDVGRFFLVVYNTSTTVSSSYATFIVMAISFALAAVFGALYYGIATGFTGFSGKRKKRGTKEDEEEEDNAKRLLLKILELISMDPSQHINIASSKRNRNSIGKSSRIDPCLLYRLCEVPTKLWRDRDELQILKLMHEYSLVTKTESNSGQEILEAIKVGRNGGILGCDARYKTECQTGP